VRLLRQSFARLEEEQGVRLSWTGDVVELLLNHGGYEPALGARPMRRTIARLVEAPVAEAVLQAMLRRGDEARTARRWPSVRGSTSCW
jgi:ATP-dependent Clp protease ATP-binding subunit ClpC